jgi:hypothetical protein
MGTHIVGCLHFANLTNKANSLTQEGTDQSLIFAVVADRASRGIDTAGERRFRNDPPTPYGREHLVLANDPVVIAEQKFQKVEHLRLELDGKFPLTQLALVAVKSVTVEHVNHFSHRLLERFLRRPKFASRSRLFHFMDQ